MNKKDLAMLQGSQSLSLKEVNRIKANFDQIYTQPDPREYYRVLYGLDYIIPEMSKPVSRKIIAALESIHKRPIRVLDLGCSYGNNAALLQYPIDIDRLAQRYMSLLNSDIPSSELIMLDRSYYRSWPRHEIEFIGCDLSKPAVDYARAVGLIKHGLVGNFEVQPLPGTAEEILRGVDLIISTGSIGYVTERTIGRLLAAIGKPAPWIASFVLRMFPYDRIEESLSAAGLVTEKMQGITFVQRRFQSEMECLQVLDRLEALGIDPEGKESNGLFHAEFFLSRPEEHVAEYPLSDLVSVVQGASRSFGRRFRCNRDGRVSLVR